MKIALLGLLGLVLGALGGVSRRLVESKDPERSYPAFKQELDVMVRGYARQIVRAETDPS